MQLGSQWYKGTADAIRQNMGYISAVGPITCSSLRETYLQDGLPPAPAVPSGTGSRAHRVVIRVPPRWQPANTACWKWTRRGASSALREARDRSACPGRSCMHPWASISSSARTLRAWLDNDLVDFGRTSFRDAQGRERCTPSTSRC